METPDKKELIDGISALLKAHEEPYELGSWENFSRPKKSKRPAVITWISIAASIAIILSAVPYLLRDQHDEAAIVSRKNLPKNKSLETTKGILPDEADLIAKADNAIPQQTIIIKTKSGKNEIPKIIQDNPSKALIAYVDAIKTPDTAKAAGQQTVKTKLTKEKENNNIIDFLQQETRMAEIKKTKVESKWNFGVELLPTVLQNKVNLGAGLTTEFRLSKSFSISSGIAYVALDATKTPGLPSGQLSAAPSTEVASFSSKKRLVSTDANISGIDIPLALTYNISKKLYTSIGVSYFNVLSETRSNNYLTELQVTSTLKNAETGLTETVRTRVAEENAELSPETVLEGNSYLGFFNLSIGHKQPVFKQYNIVIEPFMKIPVGKLSNEDLKLGNGGVKLRFTF